MTCVFNLLIFNSWPSAEPYLFVLHFTFHKYSEAVSYIIAKNTEKQMPQTFEPWKRVSITNSPLSFFYYKDLTDWTVSMIPEQKRNKTIGGKKKKVSSYWLFCLWLQMLLVKKEILTRICWWNIFSKTPMSLVGCGFKEDSRQSSEIRLLADSQHFLFFLFGSGTECSTTVSEMNQIQQWIHWNWLHYLSTLTNFNLYVPATISS